MDESKKACTSFFSEVILSPKANDVTCIDLRGGLLESDRSISEVGGALQIVGTNVRRAWGTIAQVSVLALVVSGKDHSVNRNRNDQQSY